MEQGIPRGLPVAEANAPWSNPNHGERCRQCREPFNLLLDPAQAELCIDCSVQGLPFTD